MVDLIPIIETAQRLITENGREVTLVALDSAPASASEPWKGAADPRAIPDASLVLDAVFVPAGGSGLGHALEAQDFIKRSDQIMIISPGAAVDITGFQEVIDGTSTWKITGMQILEPGNEVALAYVGVRR